MNQKDSKNKKGNWAKKDITLLTLLANESTDGARKLLKKYNKKDAFNHQDLENKLAELYFSTVDKIELEKEMAKIHPHRDWILKYEAINVEQDKKTEPDNKEETKIEQVTPEIKVIETPSKPEGDCECIKKMLMIQQEQFANADGVNKTLQDNQKDNQTLYALLGAISIVAIIGMTLNKK